MQNRNKVLIKIVATALMAALVFVTSKFLSIDLFPMMGKTTRLHLGNTMCLLSGLLFGGVSGGLASGIGSAFFDLITPQYLTSAPITFINKFAMGFVCGLISHGKGAKGSVFSRNVIAAVAGQLTYIVLYVSKTFITSMLENGVFQTAITAAGINLAVSAVNALFAVIIAVPLAAALRAPLKHTAFKMIME